MSETKTTRTQRVAFGASRIALEVSSPGAITFTLPGGETVTESPADWDSKSLSHALEYGIRRLFQDGLSGSIRDGEDADEAAQALLDKFRSGDWTATRSIGGRPTMQSVASQIVRAKYKGIKADDLKAKVAALLDESANPDRFAIVTKAYAKALADWEKTQGLAADVDI